jgi:biopolymer transport protein ExbB
MDLLKQYLDLAIFGILGLMSFFMIAYVVERYFYFARLDLSQFSTPQSLNVALTRHMTIIASIASNAPYIGLLGTVLGILITFHDLAQDEALSASVIMLGLALALKATAAGLAVAIPATVFYNALVRRVDVLTSRWQDMRPAR